MISDTALRAIRVSATLVHALRSVRLRVRGDGRLLVEVGWTLPDLDGDATGSTDPIRLAPCRFRAAAARAHALRAAGRQVGFAGLPDGHDLTVEVGLPAGGEVRRDGIYRVTGEGTSRLVVATVLGAERCQELTAEAVEEAGPPARTCEEWAGPVRLHVDEATDVVLVHAEAGQGEVGAARLGLFQELAVRLAVEELLHDVASAPT